MGVPLLDLKSQYAAMKDELDAAAAGVIEAQYFITAPRSQHSRRRSGSGSGPRTPSDVLRAATR